MRSSERRMTTHSAQDLRIPLMDDSMHGSDCSSGNSNSSGHRKAVSRALRSSRVVIAGHNNNSDEKERATSVGSRLSNTVTGSMVSHALFPYRHSIFLFLLSYAFCLMIIHDHIQVERRLDSLVVHIRKHTSPLNGTKEKNVDDTPPFYMDLNVLVGESNRAEIHKQMDKIFQDFENSHEPFRKPFMELPSFEDDLRKVQTELSRKMQIPGLRSCRWNGTGYGSAGECTSATTGPVLYYNRFDQPRYVCDNRIEPGKYLRLDEPCKKPPQMFIAPPRQRKNLEQVVLRANDPLRMHGPKPVQCDVPCATAGAPNSPVTTWSIDNTNWRIVSSRQGPQKHPSLHIRPHAHQDDFFWSTTSSKSEIPLTSYSSNMTIQGPPADYATARRAALFWEDECETPSKRERLVAQLQASGAFPIESVGECRHNTDIPAGFDGRNKTGIIGKYLFYLAFEDQIEKDHVTERIWDAYTSGSIPVYFGAQNIRELIPPESAILASDFKDMASLAQFLNKVSSDRSLYMSLHSWRSKPLPKFFVERYKFTEADETCRVCRWAQARKHGLAWNPKRQTAKPIVRTACIDGGGMVTSPVQESWDLNGKQHQLTFLRDGVNIPSSCKLSNVVASIGKRNTERTVTSKDGVLDLTLGNSVDSNLSWNFRLPTKERVELRNVYEGLAWAQYGRTRVSFLTWPRSTVKMAHSGTVEVPVVPNLHLRIVVEDLDTFHVDGDEYENFFGRKMREDMWNPVEAFAVHQ